MPLKITNPTTQVGVLNNWADQIETNIRNLTTHSSRHTESIKKIQTNGVPNSGGASTIELIIPPIFTPIDQTVSLPGPLKIGLAPEPLNTFWGGSVPGLSALTQVSTNTYSVKSTPATNPTIKFT